MSGVPPEWTILLFEALQKEVEIIARSREVLHHEGTHRGTQPPQPGAPSQSRRYRLNLDVEELGWVRQRMGRWKENLHQPIIVDIHLVTPQPHSRGDDLGRGSEPYRDLLERWYLVLEAQPTAGLMADGSSSSMTAKLKRAQKMIACMIRTLYAFLRLTPTYQLVRRLSELASSSVVAGSQPPSSAATVEISVKPGLQNSIRWDMEQLSSDEAYSLYRLPDVPTPYGTLRTTAVYRSRCDVDQVGGPAPSARLRIEPNHQIIADYVSDSEVGTPSPSSCFAHTESVQSPTAPSAPSSLPSSCRSSSPWRLPAASSSPAWQTSPLPQTPSASPFASSPPKPAAPTTSGLGQLLRAYSSEYPSDQRPYPPPPSTHEARSGQPHRGGGAYLGIPPHQRQAQPRYGRSFSYEGPESSSGSSQHSASLPIPVPPPAMMGPDLHTGGQQSPGGGPSSAEHRQHHHHHHHHHHRAHSSSPPATTVRYPPPPPPSSRWLVPSSSSTGPVNIPHGPMPHSYSGSSGGSPYYHHHHRESRASSSSSLSHESAHMMLVGGDAPPPLSAHHHRARSLDSATDTTSILEEHLNRLNLLGRGEEPSSASSGTTTEPSPNYDYIRHQQHQHHHQQHQHATSYCSSPARTATRGAQPGGHGLPHHSRSASSSAAVPSSAGSSSSSSTSSFPLGTSPQTSTTPTTPKHHPRPPSLSKQGSSSSQPPLPPSFSSLTSTPPFSVSGRGTTSAQQPQPATSPCSLGAPGLHTAVANMLPTCSPPFRTLNSLLSRSPSQPAAPSFLTSASSSSSTSSTSSFLAGGPPPPTLGSGGGGGGSSTHLRGGPCSLDGSSQPHRASLVRLGSLGHGASGTASISSSSSSSSTAQPQGGQLMMLPRSPLAAASGAPGGTPGLDCLGDSPFKQAALGGGGLLSSMGGPLLGEGSLTAGPFPGLLSLSRAGPLSSAGSQAAMPVSPSVLARRSLACLVAEEDMRDLRRKDDDDDDDGHDDHDDGDLPFALAPRPGAGSLMMGLSSTTAAAAAASSSSSSSSIHQHLAMSGIDGSSPCRGERDGGSSSTSSSSLSPAKAPAARLAEQCLAAPPLRIFGETGSSSYHGTSRLMTAHSPLRRPDAASQPSSLQGGARSQVPPPGAPPSSLLGGGGGGLSSSAVRSVRALDDDLRDFQRFRQSLARNNSSGSSSGQGRE